MRGNRPGGMPFCQKRRTERTRDGTNGGSVSLRLRTPIAPSAFPEVDLHDKRLIRSDYRFHAEHDGLNPL
jgi:hypothetical protein